MEPLNAQDQYSEQLICLPNLGFSIDQPTLPTSYGQRSDFQLKDDSIIYLCSQCLLKYLPQYDYFFPTIAQRNYLSQFIFFDSFVGPIATDSFIKRIEKAFAEFGLDYHQYCMFLPQIETQKYLSLNCLSDVFLDNFSFSGGFTTVDAIACSLPIVTYPGKIMRARQSYGMLQMIGVTETIAETEAEYIEIAVRLGLDHEWRQTVRDKMKANKHRLFNDQECVKGLETFFEEAVQKHSKIELISGDL
jgi:predicted O-linked N-acetylglucosamine transferase (SPINDLY family)